MSTLPFSKFEPEFQGQFKKKDFIQHMIVNEGLSSDAAHDALHKYCNRVKIGTYELISLSEDPNGFNPVHQLPAPVREKPVFENLLQNSTTSVGNEHLIPRTSPLYVKTSLYADVFAVIKQRAFTPIYITGPSGLGKSLTVIQACANIKIPLIRLSCTKHTNEETLIGSKTLVDGNVKVIEGPIVKAMRGGFTILLEELDTVSPNEIMCLQNILEGDAFYFSMIDELVIPRPGFNIVATGNTKGKGSDDGRFVGTQVQNEAFLDRFCFTFDANYPESAEEQKILNEYAQSIGVTDPVFIKELVAWAGGIRTAYENNATDEIISTRRLKHIISAYLIFRKKIKAVELGVARFDSITKTSFISLFKKVCSDA